MRLKKNDCILVIVDVQGKLARLMYEHEELFRNLERIVKGIKTLDIPIIWMEQNPVGLGPTISEISDLLPDMKPIAKTCFSCYGNSEFRKRLSESGRTQILLAGIETHVCVYQTALDLIQANYEVHLVTDAVSSRTKRNRDLAIRKIKDMGSKLTGVEMVLFEILKDTDDPVFRQILKIIR